MNRYEKWMAAQPEKPEEETPIEFRPSDFPERVRLLTYVNWLQAIDEAGAPPITQLPMYRRR
jgi:hypothetical protein